MLQLRISANCAKQLFIYFNLYEEKVKEKESIELNEDKKEIELILREKKKCSEKERYLEVIILDTENTLWEKKVYDNERLEQLEDDVDYLFMLNKIFKKHQDAENDLEKEKLQFNFDSSRGLLEIQEKISSIGKLTLALIQFNKSNNQWSKLREVFIKNREEWKKEKSRIKALETQVNSFEQCLQEKEEILKRAIIAKREIEDEYCSKFILLLNEKKKEIRRLQDLLDHSTQEQLPVVQPQKEKLIRTRKPRTRKLKKQSADYKEKEEIDELEEKKEQEQEEKTKQGENGKEESDHEYIEEKEKEEDTEEEEQSTSQLYRSTLPSISSQVMSSDELFASLDNTKNFIIPKSIKTQFSKKSDDEKQSELKQENKVIVKQGKIPKKHQNSNAEIAKSTKDAKRLKHSKIDIKNEIKKEIQADSSTDEDMYDVLLS